jgi:hypothetical protein
MLGKKPTEELAALEQLKEDNRIAALANRHPG